MIRLGLCCAFAEQPIRFRNTTVTAIRGMERSAALAKLSGLCLANAEALFDALQFCVEQEIGCFRINSQILPVKTHAECGYAVEDLPEGEAIVRRFRECGEFGALHQVRLCFHPDQFVVLNSPRVDVVDRSLAELEYQAEVAEWVGADVVNIHGGGAYGDKQSALGEFARNLHRLSACARSRLTVENDDVTYSPADLLPLCRSEGIPLLYDVHHHRCLPDELAIEEATQQSVETWNREPMFHLSSPLEGWSGPNPRRHHDYIAVDDFPDCWRGLDVTVEVEAKAKELAVLKLRRELEERWCVYVLRCADGSLYTGITNNLSRRVTQHNAGTGARYTRSRIPVQLVYEEPQSSRRRALQRECAIKALSRQQKELLIAAAR
ncbi:MAG: UV DNA damage repair endonuclease UvsE [Planctomycetaceae bacterium]|nr:UV DNA damage repair endonuclease UvsE [Planctomycetaceae bacterium]